MDHFTGGAGGSASTSGGSLSNSSPSNYPVVMVQSTMNEQLEFLGYDAVSGFTARALTAHSFSSLPFGPAWVRVFVNGIPPSAAQGIILAPGVPVITWPAPGNLIAGQPLTAGQLNATASIPGSFSYVPDFGTTLTAGSQLLSVTFTPQDAAHYLGSTATVTLTVLSAGSTSGSGTGSTTSGSGTGSTTSASGRAAATSGTTNGNGGGTTGTGSSAAPSKTTGSASCGLGGSTSVLMIATLLSLRRSRKYRRR